MMTEPGNPTGITGAIRKVNSIIQERKALGIDILTKDVGEHLNPGDLYDAYEAIGRQRGRHFWPLKICTPICVTQW